MNTTVIDTIFAAKKLLEAREKFLIRAAAEQSAADECTSRLTDLAGGMSDEDLGVLTSIVEG